MSMFSEQDWHRCVQLLRAGPQQGASYGAARAELAEAMMLIAGRHRTFVRVLGSAEVADIASDLIWGTASRKQTADDEPLVLSETSAAERVAMPAWRTGVLDTLETREIESPHRYFTTAIKHRLIDAVRRQHMLEEPSWNDGEGGDNWRHDGVQLPGASRDVDVEAVPRDVARTLQDAAAFGRIALQVLPALETSHPLRQFDEITTCKLRAALREWLFLAEFLERDTELGPARHRWAQAVTPAMDGHSRAWQCEYYKEERADDYWDYEECDPETTSLKYKHLERFRTSFARARRTGATVTQCAGEPAIKRRQTEGHPSVPMEWDAAQHTTLELPRKK